MGEVKINFTKDVGDVFYQQMYDAQQSLPINDVDNMVERGKDVYRLDGQYNTRLTVEEWNIIKDSYSYDHDITKRFMIKKGSFRGNEVQAEYKVDYVNEWEYYYELGQSRDFYNWLDSRKAGQEARLLFRTSLIDKLKLLISILTII